MSKPKLAVVGGGISGLCAAYSLRNEFEVAVFEGNDEFGGNNHSFQISSTLKTPMGVITFPNANVFKQTHEFIKKFNIPLVKNKIQHSFHERDRLVYSQIAPKFPFDLNFQHFFMHLHDFYYLLKGFQNEKNNSVSVRDWIKAQKISDKYLSHFLLPLVSLYLSMPYESLFFLPISVIATWWCAYMLPINYAWSYSSIKGGSQKLVEEFIKNTHVRYLKKTPVETICRETGKISVVAKDKTFEFDQIILATRADEALNLLNQPTRMERNVLSGIDVGEIMSTVHRDKSLCYKNTMTIKLMKDKQNHHVVSTWNQKNFSHQEAENAYFVSIHEVNKAPVKEQWIKAQIKLRIPLSTKSTLSALEKINDLNAQSDRVFFCGSYCSSSFYHEDAILSALKVAHIIKNNLMKK